MIMEKRTKKAIGTFVLVAFFLYLLSQPRREESLVLGLYTSLIIFGFIYAIVKITFRRLNIIGRITQNFSKYNNNTWYFLMLNDIKEKLKRWIDGIKGWVYDNL